MGELAIAAAGFVALWQLLEAPGAGERRAVADFVAAATATARADPGQPKAAPAADARSSETSNELHPSPAKTEPAADVSGPGPESPSLDEARDIRDAARFARAEIAIRLALQDAPELARQVVTERSAGGLRIRIVSPSRTLFMPGRAEPGPDAQRLLAAISPAVAALSNPISVCGHTEGPDDWALSAARADAARKLLEANGVPPARFREIAAQAAGDGGVAITLLRDGPNPDTPERAPPGAPAEVPAEQP